ncbi:MAG: flagellar basal body-associated FliL family protein [Balneolales bacterium]
MNENEDEEQQFQTFDKPKRKRFPRLGKYLLFAAIVIAQAVVAYIIINNNYPAIRETVDSYRSTGGYFINLNDIIINPAESGGTRYLVTSLAFEFDNQADYDSAGERQAQILDRVNMHLRAKSISDLNSLEMREQIRVELKEEVDGVLGQKMVRNLFFTKYVIQ